MANNGVSQHFKIDKGLDLVSDSQFATLGANEKIVYKPNSEKYEKNPNYSNVFDKVKSFATDEELGDTKSKSITTIDDANVSGVCSCKNASGTQVDTFTCHVSKSASNPTLSWGSTATIGTIDGTAFNVTMPANPDTKYSAGSNITLTGTTFSLTKANVTGALGYTPLSSHQDISGKANTSGTYPNLNVGYADIAGNGVDSSGGTWIRFKNGIQMLIMTHIISNQWENFSMPFINVNTMSMVVSPVDSTANSLSAKVDEYTATRYFVRVYNNDNNNAQYTTSCTIFAMGFWK